MKYGLKRLKVERKMAYHSSAFFVYLDGEKYWEYLETGKDPDELYPEHFRVEVIIKQYSDYLDSVILPGEQYQLLEQTGYDYALTSYGRVFNCKKQVQIRTYFAKNDVVLFIRDVKVVAKRIFKNNNWPFDYDKIYNDFATNKWPHSHHKDENEKIKERLKQLG